MAQNTKISWAHHTFNPWVGCSKVSPGCKFCYAETLNHRWGKNNLGTTGTRAKTSLTTHTKSPHFLNHHIYSQGQALTVL